MAELPNSHLRTAFKLATSFLSSSDSESITLILDPSPRRAFPTALLSSPTVRRYTSARLRKSSRSSPPPPPTPDDCHAPSPDLPRPPHQTIVTLHHRAYPTAATSVTARTRSPPTVDCRSAARFPVTAAGAQRRAQGRHPGRPARRTRTPSHHRLPAFALFSPLYNPLRALQIKGSWRWWRGSSMAER